MRKSILVALAAILVLGFSSCCKCCDKKKCNGKCEVEVTDCMKKKAHDIVLPMAGELNLTAEQAEQLETLFAEKMAREVAAEKCFGEKLKEVLGEEKFAQLEANCPRHRHHGCRPPHHPCDKGFAPCPCMKDGGECKCDTCKCERVVPPCCDKRPEGCCKGEKPCCEKPCCEKK